MFVSTGTTLLSLGYTATLILPTLDRDMALATAVMVIGRVIILVVLREDVTTDSLFA